MDLPSPTPSPIPQPPPGTPRPTHTPRIQRTAGQRAELTAGLGADAAAWCPRPASGGGRHRGDQAGSRGL